MRAYAACPLCGPARRSMLTGLFPHNHGEIKNDTNHPFDRQLYLEALADRGYDNYYYGKWHAGPGTAHEFGCQGVSWPSYNNPYTKPEYHEYLRGRGLSPAEHLIERVFWPQSNPRNKMRVGERYRCQGAWCNEHASGLTLTPSDTHEAFFLANLACERLAELARSSTRRPFCLRVDFWGPHQPYFPSQEFAELYEAEDIPVYGNFTDTLEHKPEIYLSESNVPMGENDRLVRPNPLPWEEWQKVLARAYAHVTMVDAAGGRVLQALERLGLSERTLVIWTTDHGDALACHGGHFDKRSYMPEEMVRIPMAMRWPGHIEPGQVSPQLVSNLDMAPTILDAAGTGFSQPVDGRSLLPLALGRQGPWREELMCETHGHGNQHFGRLVVTERFKYIANRGQLDELYDLQSDPYEMENLIDDAGCSAVLEDMRRRLGRWQRETGDEPVHA